MVSQIKSENEDSSTEKALLEIFLENSKNFEKEELPKDYVSPVVICIQSKLKKTLTTLLWWECDINAFHIDQTNGWTTIEVAFETHDLNLIDLIVKKAKFESFVIFKSSKDIRTLFDVLESVYLIWK